jgi:hypothetical protein
MFMPVSPAAGLVPGDAGLAVALLQVLSHVTLAAGALYAAMRGHVYLATNGFAELALSLMYHMCRGSLYCFGLLRDDARKMDNIGAPNLGGALVLHLLLYDRGRDTGGAARTLLPFVVLVAVFEYPYQVQALVLVALYLLLVAVYRYVRDGELRMPASGDYLGRWLTGGTVALALGFASFSYTSGAPLENAVMDGVLHALWHLAAGAALFSFSHAVAPAAEWWDVVARLQARLKVLEPAPPKAPVVEDTLPDREEATLL